MYQIYRNHKSLLYAQKHKKSNSNKQELHNLAVIGELPSRNVDPEEGSSCELASFFHPASAPEMVVARTNEFNQIFDFCTGM